MAHAAIENSAHAGAAVLGCGPGGSFGIEGAFKAGGFCRVPALLLAVGGAFVIFQLALWLAYRAQLTLVQWAGIVTVLAGMVITMMPKRPAAGGLPAQHNQPAAEKVRT